MCSMEGLVVNLLRFVRVDLCNRFAQRIEQALTSPDCLDLQECPGLVRILPYLASLWRASL